MGGKKEIVISFLIIFCLTIGSIMSSEPVVPSGRYKEEKREENIVPKGKNNRKKIKESHDKAA